jgi:hypothetical protein
VTRTALLVRRARSPLLAAAAVLGAIGFLWLLLGPVTTWATPVAGLTGKDLADVRTATRQTLLAAVGGLAVLAGLAFTARTYYLTRRGQLTDRYTKAIALLASDKLTERLGGIYALEHLMAESDRDHDTVVEVLAAFIRQHPAPSDDPAALSDYLSAKPPARHDVQAALTVLGRRPRRPERNPPNLRGTDLREMEMIGLHLPGVDFFGADLRGAVLLAATLTGANLSSARLQRAHLSGARMQGAKLQWAQLEMGGLVGADLQDAELDRARLQRARLGGANLTGATFDGAELSGADFTGDFTMQFVDGETVTQPTRGLTLQQLATAEVDGGTLLPDDLRAALDEHRRRQRGLGAAPDQDPELTQKAPDW